VVGVALAVVAMIGVGAVFGDAAAIAVAVVVTFGVGAVFGDAAAIAVAVVAGIAGFAFEIGDMQSCSGPPLGTKVWSPMRTRVRRAAGPRRARGSPSASVRLALVEVAVVGSPDRLVLLDLGGGCRGGRRELEFELGSVECVCCLVDRHRW
jgi:hypothetical protein